MRHFSIEIQKKVKVAKVVNLIHYEITFKVQNILSINKLPKKYLY